MRNCVIFEQIFYRVNSPSQFNALIQFLNGKVGVFPTFPISLKLFSSRLFSMQNLQNSESLISFYLEQIVLIIAANFSFLYWPLFLPCLIFVGTVLTVTSFILHELFLLSPVSILPKISKIFDDTYETLNQFIYNKFYYVNFQLS